MKILLAGNTGYVTEKFIRSAFPDCWVTVLDNERIHSSKKDHITSLRLSAGEDQELSGELGGIFDAYGFDRVVYFSNYLTCHGLMSGEMEQLRRILQCCCQRKGIQVLYLSGPEAGYCLETGKTVLAEAAENLCIHYRKYEGLQIRILRLLYLYSSEYQNDFLYRLMEQMNRENSVIFLDSPEQRLFFMCMEDLAELLFRLFDSWPEEEAVLCVPECFGLTFENLVAELKKLSPGLEVAWGGKSILQEIPDNDKVLRRMYGWFPRISVLTELPSLYQRYLEGSGKKPGWAERLDAWRQRTRHWRQVVELGLGFVLMELLMRTVGNQVQFKLIDIRLLFVVILSTIYGMNIGISAAALASFSLIAAYVRQGTGWTTLFYQPSNWIPFIAYFMVGAICGYVRMKDWDELAFKRKENELIQDKFFFVRRLYLETLEDKREYKKQIIGSQDSFGKIFHITQQLDVVHPQEIFIRTIKILEDTLENHTISMYSFGQNRNFARLEAASGMIWRRVPNSIRMEDYQELIQPLEEGEVWSNTRLMEGYPMYAAGIRRDGLVLMIFVQEAEYSQMSLYYVNLLKILCGLVETALLRALDYQAAYRDVQYLSGSRIMKEQYFLERLRLYHSMREEKLAEYTLVRLERGEMDLEEAEHLLTYKIRENDVVGVTTDGTLYVILIQTDQEHAAIVTNRLEDSGFHCTVCAGGEI